MYISGPPLRHRSEILGVESRKMCFHKLSRKFYVEGSVRTTVSMDTIISIASSPCFFLRSFLQNSSMVILSLRLSTFLCEFQRFLDFSEALCFIVFCFGVARNRQSYRIFFCQVALKMYTWMWLAVGCSFGPWKTPTATSMTAWAVTRAGLVLGVIFTLSRGGLKNS